MKETRSVTGERFTPCCVRVPRRRRRIGSCRGQYLWRVVITLIGMQGCSSLGRMVGRYGRRGTPQGVGSLVKSAEGNSGATAGGVTPSRTASGIYAGRRAAVHPARRATRARRPCSAGSELGAAGDNQGDAARKNCEGVRRKTGSGLSGRLGPWRGLADRQAGLFLFPQARGWMGPPRAVQGPP